MTEPIYETPKSRLLKEEHRKETMSRLLREQSAVGVVLGTVFGLVPSLLFMALVTWLSNTLSVVLSLLPGIVVGVTVKYCARPFRASYRMIPALVTTFAMLLFFAWVGTNAFVFLLAFVNGIIVLGTSKRRLNHLEEKALYYYKLGRLDFD